MLSNIHTYLREMKELEEKINQFQTIVKDCTDDEVKKVWEDKLYQFIEESNHLYEIIERYKEEGYCFQPQVHTRKQLEQIRKVAKMALTKGWRVYGTIYTPGFLEEPQVLGLGVAKHSIDEWELHDTVVSFYPKSKKITFTSF